MPWVEALTDLNELRRCIHDLVSTLPAVWTNWPLPNRQRGGGVMSMLDADFVYVALPPSIEITTAVPDYRKKWPASCSGHASGLNGGEPSAS